MTKQIVIKLNEKKFGPILEKLERNEYSPVKSHSEFIGKILFSEYLLWNQKCNKLEDQTRMHTLIKILKQTHAEFMKNLLSQYPDFISSKKRKDLSKIKKCICS